MSDDATLLNLAHLALRWSLPIDTLGTGSTRIALDGASSVAVVAAGWEPVPRALVVDVSRGRLLETIEVATISLFGCPRSVLCHDTGWRGSARSDAPRLLEVSADGVVVRAVAPDCAPLDVGPGGDEVLVRAGNVLRVCRWPGLVETHAFQGYDAAVDWSTRTLVFRSPVTDTVQAWSFAARIAVERSIPTRPGESVCALGAGLIAPRYGGLTIVSLQHGWRREVLPARRKEYGAIAALDATGTRARFLLGGKPRVVSFVRATGEVLEAPCAQERLARKSDGLFHPSLDVAVYSKSRAQPSVDLRLAAQGQPIVARLGPGVEPLTWTPDGRTLFATRADGGSRTLQAWSIA